MKFKQELTATKLRGGYYTPPQIARFLAEWVLEADPHTLLEPSCGDGAFFRALGSLETNGLTNVVGVEQNEGEAYKATMELNSLGLPHGTVIAADFIGWAKESIARGHSFDAVLGNPPYVRYQYLSAEHQSSVQELFTGLGFKSTKHMNSWVPFVAASIQMLAPQGRLGMLLPSEIFHVIHAQPLRDMLMAECSRIMVIDPSQLWIDGVLQGVVLLLVEKKRKNEVSPTRFVIKMAQSTEVLARKAEDIFFGQEPVISPRHGTKWMKAFLTQAEVRLVDEAEHRPGISTFIDLADVDVGIVTGANKFFLVPDSIVDRFGLHPWAHPMFGRSTHIKGAIVDESDIEANRRAGLPCNFIWFDKTPKRDLPSNVRAYLKTGEATDLHLRYKCRVRDPWYSVPSVYPAPVGMLKRCHHFPRAIWNRAEAFTTDTSYRIRARTTTPDQLVGGFVNSLTALTAELEGRHYGGGVLELVPSEIERLLVPNSVTLNAVDDLDAALRKRMDAKLIMEQQDRHTLINAGFTDAESDQLRDAWIRLRNRRQRMPSEPAVNQGMPFLSLD